MREPEGRDIVASPRYRYPPYRFRGAVTHVADQKGQPQSAIL